jgi:hypothetical protein
MLEKGQKRPMSERHIMRDTVTEEAEAAEAATGHRTLAPEDTLTYKQEGKLWMERGGDEYEGREKMERSMMRNGVYGRKYYIS